MTDDSPVTNFGTAMADAHPPTVYGTDEHDSVSRDIGPMMFERIAQRVADHPDLPIDTSWRTIASCRDTDPDLFFPIGTTGAAIVQIDEAKAVCMGCAAQTPCLEYALLTNQDSGIWGGTSEEDRRHLRRTFIGRRRSRLI